MAGLFERLQAEIDSQESGPGLSPIDLLDLPTSIAAIVKKIVRRNGMSLAEITAEMDHSPAESRQLMDQLVDRGLMRRVDVRQETWYKANFGRKAGKSSSSVWATLDHFIEQEHSSPPTGSETG